jgi:tetratricopeptide (TPR) repeat protein
MVLTLGLIEAWYDREQSIYVQETPVGKAFAKHSHRFGFEQLSYEHCHAFVRRSVEAVREINPTIKILVTTSPVPLTRTFTEDDIITANMQSKSILRAVAGDVAAANSAMDYFPSYESVTMTKSWDVWDYDMLHVSDSFVGKVVSRLTEVYCPEIDESRRKSLDFYIASAGKNPNEVLELASELAGEDTPEYHRRMSRLLDAKGETAQAASELRKVVQATPDNAPVRFEMSKLLVKLDRLDEAVVEARLSTELEPTNVPYRRYLASLCAKNRSYSEALHQRFLAFLYRRQYKTRSARLKHFYARLTGKKY